MYILNSVSNNFCYKIIIILLLFLQIRFDNNKANLLKSGDNSLQDKNKLKIINEFTDIFNDLYHLFRPEDMGKNSIHHHSKIFSKNCNKVLLCAVGKSENLYAKEFVEFYQNLGFDKIIIFDNNDLDGEKFDDILKDFISDKIVEIVDIRGLKSVQLSVYNYCYRNYKNLYDWIAFFDFDEYLYMKYDSNIKYYLSNSRFQKCETIFLNWHVYDDNDLLRYDNRTMIQRFTNFKYLSCGKLIVRGKLHHLLITSSHRTINSNYCNSKGELIYPKSYVHHPKENNSIAYLRHYYMKTAEEYCSKILRGDVQMKISPNVKKINRFFLINKKTKEKIKILEKCFNITYK